MAVVFMHPFNSPTTTIVFQNVELGNTERYDMKVGTFTAMDGKLRSKVKSGPRQNIYTFTLFNMTPNKVHELRDFISDVEDDEIRIRDWNNVEYQVKIVNEPIAINSPGRGPKVKDGYNIELEVIGDTV